jgi:hypothetical protein
MKTLKVTGTGVAALVGTGGAWAQTQMMQGGMWGGGWMGGYGGPWGTVLLIAVVAVLVVWIVQRKGK